MSVRPFVCPSVPSTDRSSGVRRVCCWAPCGQETASSSNDAASANAGSVTFTAVVECCTQTACAYAAVCIHAGYVMSYWNRPYFPEYCGDAQLNDHQVYDTMVRIAASMSTERPRGLRHDGSYCRVHEY